MLSFLSSTQRLWLFVGLIAASQGAVALGLSAGWSAGLTIGVSAGCAALATWIFLDGITTLGRFLAEFKRHAQRLAGGDLSQDIPVTGGADSAQVLQALAQLQNELRRTMGSIKGGAEGVSLAASEIAQGNADLSVRTEQTSSNLQSAAGSMSRLTSTVNQTADSARTANQLASSASEVAARGGQVVSQVVSTMDEINHSSKKIADIIGTIDGIAFQTNILALNAAVEAARAGEQGRGFAVVAGEVRSLAQRSAEAAREIKSLIGSSVEKVESGSRLVQDAGQTMNEIVASVQRVSDIIGEISAAAAEQSSGIVSVNDTVTQLDQATQQNAALVEQSAAAAESLKDQAQRLATAVASFKLGGHAVAAPAAPVARAHAPVGQAAASPAAKAGAAPRQAASSAIDKARSQSLATTGTKPAAARPAPAAKAAATRAEPAAPRAAAAPAAAGAVTDEWESF